MLSPANADLVRRDTQLPGLSRLLDAEAFLAALQAAAPDAALRAAHLHCLRYRPGQSCRASYTLELDNQRVECHAMAYRRADTKLAKAGLRRTTAGPLGCGRFIWPEWGIEVCVFPNDNKLKALARMSEPAQRQDLLRTNLPEHRELWRSAVHSLAYKPQRRWVGALEVGGRPKAVCKLYDDVAFDSALAKSERIRPGEVLRIAPLLGRSAERCALFFGWQEGQLLSEALLEPAFEPAALRRVGVALAELHRQEACLPLRSREAEAGSLLAVGELLAWLLPKTAPQLLEAARTLAGRINGLPQRQAVIHGDCYAKQVLLSDQTVTLFDLDEAARGDPLSDLGTFLARVERDVICGRLTASQREGIREELLAGYGAADIDSRQLELHIAAKLFARMSNFFRTCAADWPALIVQSAARVESLLSTAAERCDHQAAGWQVQNRDNLLATDPAELKDAAARPNRHWELNPRRAVLPPADADLIRRDTALPGLATVLDPASFLAALQAAAPEAGLREARLRYRRYKPGRNCLVACTLELPGASLECYAKAYRRVDASKLLKAESRPTVAGPLGNGRFVWPDLATEVCVFPNDNKIATLSRLADPNGRADFLRRRLPEHSAVWPSELRLLAYKPERRWVGALEVDGNARAVCKLYSETAFREAGMKSNCLASGDVLQIAPLLGSSQRRRALFFGWQTGRALSEALYEPGFEATHLTRVGIALAELHRQEIPELPLVLRASEVAGLHALGGWLGFLLAPISTRIQAVAEQLAVPIGALPQRAATIHGDFHDRQVLLDGDAVKVLDLDEASRGDPLADLGTFLAHLEREVIRGRLTAAQRDDFREALLGGYRSVSGALELRQLDLYVAAKLFARMQHFFRSCSPDWPDLIRESLARVECLLGANTARTSAPKSAVVADGKVAKRESETPASPLPTFPPAHFPLPDSGLPALAHALDLSRAEAWVAAALREHDPEITAVNIHAVKLRRHKPARRAIIEYELECVGSGGSRERFVSLGKIQARGVDEQNLELLEALCRAEFSPDSPDGISIPEPIGVVPELSLWLQRKAAGQPAAALLTGLHGPVVARRAAAAVCKLHRTRLPLNRTHTPADEIALVRKRLAAVAELHPAWCERLACIADSCEWLADGLPRVSPRTIHRDFYHDQLLVTGDRVWLVDLDLLCAGDPALDAGNFTGHLIEWSLRSPADRPALERATESFTDSFLELTGADAQDRVATWTTLTLARHIFISTQFPDRTPFTETILELCEKRCGLARSVVRGAAFTHKTI